MFAVDQEAVLSAFVVLPLFVVQGPVKLLAVRISEISIVAKGAGPSSFGFRVLGHHGEGRCAEFGSYAFVHPAIRQYRQNLMLLWRRTRFRQPRSIGTYVNLIASSRRS